MKKIHILSCLLYTAVSVNLYAGEEELPTDNANGHEVELEMGAEIVTPCSINCTNFNFGTLTLKGYANNIFEVNNFGEINSEEFSAYAWGNDGFHVFPSRWYDNNADIYSYSFPKKDFYTQSPWIRFDGSATLSGAQPAACTVSCPSNVYIGNVYIDDPDNYGKVYNGNSFGNNGDLFMAVGVSANNNQGLCSTVLTRVTGGQEIGSPLSQGGGVVGYSEEGGTILGGGLTSGVQLKDNTFYLCGILGVRGDIPTGTYTSTFTINLLYE